MDISELLAQPRHMNPGAATPFLEGFGSELASMGHTSLTISGYLSSARITQDLVDIVGQTVAIEVRCFRRFEEQGVFTELDRPLATVGRPLRQAFPFPVQRRRAVLSVP